MSKDVGTSGAYRAMYVMVPRVLSKALISDVLVRLCLQGKVTQIEVIRWESTHQLTTGVRGELEHFLGFPVKVRGEV